MLGRPGRDATGRMRRSARVHANSGSAQALSAHGRTGAGRERLAVHGGSAAGPESIETCSRSCSIKGWRGPYNGEEWREDKDLNGRELWEARRISRRGLSGTGRRWDGGSVQTVIVPLFALERNQISNQTELRGDWTFRCEASERTPSFPANISRLSQLSASRLNAPTLFIPTLGRIVFP